METKNSLPIVMSFIVDYVTALNQEKQVKLEKLSIEERTATLADIFSKPVSSLPENKVENLCNKLKEFCKKQENVRAFIKFPDLFTLDELARYFALKEEIYRIPTRERLIKLWAKESGAEAKKLMSASIDSKVITRCLAIRLCEMSEELTGRVILADSNTPMQYLGAETTFSDIIDYFTVGSKKIDDIRYKIFKASPQNIQAYLALFRQEVAKAYALNCGFENLSEAELEAFQQKRIHDCKCPNFQGDKDWDLPIWWTEEQLDIQLSGNFNWVTPNTTVNDLVEVFAKVKENRLQRK